MFVRGEDCWCLQNHYKRKRATTRVAPTLRGYCILRTVENYCPDFSILAQESFKVEIRLKTSFPGLES
jgi:hypothetical protein